jgi:hypothetical protein
MQVSLQKLPLGANTPSVAHSSSETSWTLLAGDPNVAETLGVLAMR